MESENKVDALMAMIDKSLKEVDKVEDLMDYYEQKLQVSVALYDIVNKLSYDFYLKK